MSTSSQDLAKIETDNQKNLILFLLNELSFGATLLESARLAESDGHWEDFGRVKHDLTRISETLSKFIPRISEAALRAGLESQHAQLDRRRAELK